MAALHVKLCLIPNPNERRTVSECTIRRPCILSIHAASTSQSKVRSDIRGEREYCYIAKISFITPYFPIRLFKMRCSAGERFAEKIIFKHKYAISED